MLELVNNAIFNNNIFYSTILMFVIASFIGAMVIIALKSYNMIYNNFYTYLFEKDLWSQSLEKNITNAAQWENKSILVRMFSEGVKTFIGQYKKSTDYNYGSNLELTKGTMRVILKEEYELFSQGLNILAFNSVFIPYTTISLSVYDLIIVFQSVGLNVLELSMFVKPLIIFGIGLFLTGITSILYLVIQSRLDYEQEKLEVFVERFGNFLHKSFYTKRD